MYFIKKIILISNKGVSSEVKLQMGLNIICGESNTGKSLVFDCIDFMTGAQKHRFDEKLDIKEISMIISKNDKDITLTRELNSNEIKVNSGISEINSGIYSTKNRKNHIKELWLKLMDIDNIVNIVSNLQGKTQELSYRTFNHNFQIDEVRVLEQASILASKNSFGDNVATSVISSLLYLATDKNYLPEKNIKDKKIRNARKEAVTSFVNRSFKKIESQKISDFSEYSDKTPADLERSIDQLINDIGLTEGVLDEMNHQINEVSKKIFKVGDKINECKVLYSRNKNLASQYASDLRRLTFIAEGDIHSKDLPELDRCPFCNGELVKNQSQSCVEAAIVEVEKIKMQINDLKSFQESLKTEGKDLEDERDKLIKERHNLENSIRRELKPKISELRKQLQKYTIALEQYKAKEMINKFNDILLTELKVTEEEESGEFKIDIAQKFRDIFLGKLEKELDYLLKECKYHNYSNCKFNVPGYDITINGQEKRSQGKGYRAFLNTLVAIAVQNCLYDFDLHIPTVFVVDSPILSLKEKEDETKDEYVSNSMKVGLFTYLVNHQTDRQFIIIENNIPNIDYGNSNLIKFTKDENNGRYGLLTNFKG